MKTLIPSLAVRRDPIRAAFQRAYTVVPAPPAALPPDTLTPRLLRFDQRIQGVASQITEILSLRAGLLGIERQQRQVLTDQVAGLEKKRRDIQKSRSECLRAHTKIIRDRKREEREVVAESRRAEKYASQFKRIDLDPLRWRNAKKWPLIALFSLASSTFTLGVRAKWKYGNWTGRKHFSTKRICSPDLPHVISDCYKDVLDALVERAKNKKKTFILSAEFNGVIPLATKEKIAAAADQFSHVFILAQVKDWKLEEKKPSVGVRPKPVPMVWGDPLVVGWNGGKDLWLIDSFDPTTLERYIEQVHAATPRETAKN